MSACDSTLTCLVWCLMQTTRTSVILCCPLSVRSTRFVERSTRFVERSDQVQHRMTLVRVVSIDSHTRHVSVLSHALIEDGHLSLLSA